MKNQFQKIALLLGCVLVVAVVAYYFKNSKGTPAVNSNSTGSGDLDNSLKAPPGGSLITSSPGDANTGASSPTPTANLPLPDQGMTPPGTPAPGAAMSPMAPAGIAPAPVGIPGSTTLPAPGGYQSATQPFAMTAPATTPAGRDLSNDYSQPAPAPPENRTYTIKSGDTFSIIAKAIYHDSAHWKEIAQANPSVDPIKLKIGQVIKLPDLSTPESSEARRPATPAGADEGTAASEKPRKQVVYTVQFGDTLSSIARHFYKDRSLGKLIYQANRKAIGHAR